jgi:hypothetical protein
MAGSFYGSVSTPSRIVARPKGRTIQLTPPVLVPVVGADDDASNQQLQPSVIELLKVMEAQQKEIEKLKKLSEEQNEKLAMFSNTLESVQSAAKSPENRSKAVPKDALVRDLYL